MIHDGRTGLMVSRPVSCFAVARRGWRNKVRPAWLAATNFSVKRITRSD
jgi:hypothetical protein